jgi:hypothetical protein
MAITCLVAQNLLLLRAKFLLICHLQGGREMRQWSIITMAFLIAGLFVTPVKARSQTTSGEDLVIQMAEQQKIISIFNALDYQVREHFLLVANAMLSTYGGWNSIDRLNADNVSKLRDSKTDFEQQVIELRRNIGRLSAITADELQAVNEAIVIYESLIETGARIAELSDEGNADGANQVYFTNARLDYMRTHRILYTLITAAERRVATMARAPHN